MADPRAATTNRIGAERNTYHTYKADGADIVYSASAAHGSAVVGRAVMLSGAGIVRLAGAGDLVLGKLIQVEPDGYCLVQVGGVTDLPAGDNGAAVNNQIVGDTLSAARGYIRSVATPGGAYAQAAATDAARGRHVVLDAAVSTAIEVLLGG